MTARTVMQPADITRALTRISHEILESNRELLDTVILGIPTRGVVLAQRIGETMLGATVPGETMLRATVPGETDLLVAIGSLDVTMYRDDLGRNPTRTPGRTELPARGIDGKLVVLVDDVLYSGRTIRAALDALSAIGRPRYVRLATLVDRGHRELPIRPDFVGKNLPTAEGERINVRLLEVDGVEEVTIES